jgi:hypothetical protein
MALFLMRRSEEEICCCRSICASNPVEAVGDERAEVYPHKLNVSWMYRVDAEQFIELNSTIEYHI